MRRLGLQSFMLFFLFTVVSASLALQLETIEEYFRKGGLSLEDIIVDNPDYHRVFEHVGTWPESDMVLAENVYVGEILKATVIPHGAEVIQYQGYLRWNDEKIIDLSPIPVWRDVLAGLMDARYVLYESSELTQLRALLYHDVASIIINRPESVIISPPDLPNGIIITDRSRVTIVYHNLLFTLIFQPREGGIVPDEDLEYVRSLLANFIRELSKQHLVESTPRPPIARYLGREITNDESVRVGMVRFEYDAKYDEYKKILNVSPDRFRRIQEEGRELAIMIYLPWPDDVIRINIRAENERGHVLEESISVKLVDWTEQKLPEEEDR